VVHAVTDINKDLTKTKSVLFLILNQLILGQAGQLPVMQSGRKENNIKTWLCLNGRHQKLAVMKQQNTVP
jgi:hypothetical protein